MSLRREFLSYLSRSSILLGCMGPVSCNVFNTTNNLSFRHYHVSMQPEAWINNPDVLSVPLGHPGNALDPADKTFSESKEKVKVKDIDGVSLISLLMDPENTLSRKALYWHYPHYHSAGIGPQGAIRQEPYKLIEWFEKSIYGTDGAVELYHLENDPAEENNLADSLPDLAAKMLFDLQAWRKQVDVQEMEKWR